MGLCQDTVRSDLQNAFVHTTTNYYATLLDGIKDPYFSVERSCWQNFSAILAQ